MGTRVDFYVGRGENAEWLGSYGYDGYPEGVFGDDPSVLSGQATEVEWRAWVAHFIEEREGIKPNTWPWPWETSATTDYAYAWDNHNIYGSNFGHPWFGLHRDLPDLGQLDDEEHDRGPRPVWPDMAHRMKVELGPASGVMVLSVPAPTCAKCGGKPPAGFACNACGAVTL